jgi:signal peptidase I
LIKVVIKKPGEKPKQFIYSSASYQKINRKYYLKNLDVFNPIKTNPANQFRTKYFSSLEFGDIILRKPPKIKNPIPRQLKAHYLDNNKRKIVKDVHSSYWNAIKNADFIKSPQF